MAVHYHIKPFVRKRGSSDATDIVRTGINATVGAAMVGTVARLID